MQNLNEYASVAVVKQIDGMGNRIRLKDFFELSTGRDRIEALDCAWKHCWRAVESLYRSMSMNLVCGDNRKADDFFQTKSSSSIIAEKNFTVAGLFRNLLVVSNALIYQCFSIRALILSSPWCPRKVAIGAKCGRCASILGVGRLSETLASSQASESVF